MNPSPLPQLQRILLAQSIAGSHLGAKKLALELARRHRLELLQLVIEDLALLRAAQLPQAQEILHGSGEQRVLSGPYLQAAARLQAEQLAREMTQENGVRGSVRRVQGHFPGAGAENLQAGDVLVLAKPTHRRWMQIADDAPVLLIYDTQDQRESLETLTTEIFNHETRHRRLDIVPRPDPALIEAALRQQHPALILASAAPALCQHQFLARLLDAVDCPLILLA